MKSGEIDLSSPYGDLVGRKVLSVDREHGTIEVEYLAHEQFTNRIGTVAGAMIAGLLDSVTGLAANLDLPEDLFAVHRSLSVEYHRPAAPGRLIGRGRVVSAIERDIRSDGELLDDQGVRIATATAALRVIRWGNNQD
jgi:uncharacterized protein (TIGR00369 family)